MILKEKKIPPPLKKMGGGGIHTDWVDRARLYDTSRRYKGVQEGAKGGGFLPHDFYSSGLAAL